MLDMKFLDPVLELFNNPASTLAFRLDLSHAEILQGINYRIDKQSQIKQTYGKVESLLKTVGFKLCIIYSSWLKGTLSLTNEQIVQITTGLNYEIEEVRYHVYQLGMIILPSLQQVDDNAFNAYKKLLLQYLYGANLTCPDRFVTDIDHSVPSGYTDQQIQAFRNKICVPHISYVENADYTAGTIWTKEDIDGYLNNVGITDSVHPCISLLIDFCQNIEWIFDTIPFSDIEGELPTNQQKAILCLLSLLPKWANVNIGSLLKDEQVFTVAYNGLKSDKKQQAPYSLWRDAEITRRLTPTVNISATLN